MATRAGRPPSILLVSNSVDERDVSARSLRAWGYRVVSARSTVLAYQIATTRPTDMVVTDGHCAGAMSGLELTRRLRLHARTTTVPIIVLTSVMRRQDGELSIKAGADVFLEKPLSDGVLCEHVARLLGLSGRRPRRAPSPRGRSKVSPSAPNRHSETPFLSHGGSSAGAAPVSRTEGAAHGSAGRGAHPEDQRTCPECRGLLEYRHRSPVIAVTGPDDRAPRERLR
jgi:CheY-like chemotaxis protein